MLQAAEDQTKSAFTDQTTPAAGGMKAEVGQMAVAEDILFGSSSETAAGEAATLLE